MSDQHVSPSSAVRQDASDRRAEWNGQELAEAKRYHAQSFFCDLLDRILDVTYLALIAHLVSLPLESYLVDRVPARMTRLALTYLIITLGHIGVSLPLSYYAGHLLEHRFGLSRQSALRWLGQYAKRHALTLIFGVLMTCGLYFIIWNTGRWWWLVAAAAYFALSIVLGQLAPVLILPLFYKIEPFHDATLDDRLKTLSRGTGLSISGVYRMRMSDETAKANAMLAGLGNTRRVILGDTLLDQFSPDEIAVVFAHEIGHHVHRHVGKMIGAGMFYCIVGLFVCDRALAWWVSGGSGAIDYNQLPVSSYAFLTLVLTLFSQVIEPLQNMISRHFERQADRYALTHTGQPAAYRSAFRQLSRMNKTDPNPHPWEVFLFHSHPPIQERLAMADAYDTQQHSNPTP